MVLWYTIYDGLLILALLLGLLRWRKLSRADSILLALLLIAILQESLSELVIRQGKSNLPSLHIYSPIELVLTCLYFRESSDVLWLKKAAVIAAVVGGFTSLFNTTFLQTITTFNSNFLLFEATTIIVLCLLKFYASIIRENSTPLITTQFWITLCLLFYWSFSFASYGMRGIPKSYSPDLFRAIQAIVVIANLLFYAGLATIFALYPRLRPSGE